MGLEKELSALVATHGVWLSALLRGLTRCEADAEDAFQEVWMRVIKLGGLPKGASPRAYLASAARSVVIDRYRRDGCGREVFADAASETEGGLAVAEIADDAPAPDARCESAATHEEILAAVRALPSGMRSVVLLRIEGELSFQEIADELGVPLGTVLSWMRRATMKLKKIVWKRL